MDSGVDFLRMMESKLHLVGSKPGPAFVNPLQPFSPRQGTGHIAGDWAAKTEADFVRKPFYRRDTFHHVIVIAVCVAALAVGLWQVLKAGRERDSEIDLAGQRRCVVNFSSSDEFSSFVRISDANLLERLASLADDSKAANALLPEVAAWEKAHGLPSWAAQFTVNRSGARRDELFRTERAVCELLARRGVVFDLDRRITGRRWFVQSVQPFAAAFFARAPDNGFSSLRRDASLQDLLLAAYGADRGANATVTDVERLFYLAAKLNAAPPVPAPASEVSNTLP